MNPDTQVEILLRTIRLDSVDRYFERIDDERDTFIDLFRRKNLSNGSGQYTLTPRKKVSIFYEITDEKFAEDIGIDSDVGNQIQGIDMIASSGVAAEEEDDSNIDAIAAIAGAGVSLLAEYRTKKGASELLSTVRISGLTTREHLAKNKANTVIAFKSLFKTAVMNDTPLDQTLDKLDIVTARRKRDTLTTIKNVMSGVRGRARAIASVGQDVTWVNNGVLDAGTTNICRRYMTSTWDLPYSQIPDKPPRVAITPHPCRSFLTTRPRGASIEPEPPFMDQFNDSDELKEELLPPVVLKNFNSGKTSIERFSDYENSVLRTPKETEAAVKAVVVKSTAKPQIEVKPQSQPVSPVIQDGKIELNLDPLGANKGIEAAASNIPGVSAEQRSQIRFYLRDGYKDLNKVMRDPSKYTDATVKRANEISESINSAIKSRKVTEDLILYRGVKSDSLYDSAGGLVGKDLPNASIQSASKSLTTAEDFAGIAGDGLVTISTGSSNLVGNTKQRSVLLKINVKKGSGALDVDGLDLAKHKESEVMLGSGSLYRVRDATYNDDHVVIEVDYVE